MNSCRKCIVAPDFDRAIASRADAEDFARVLGVAGEDDFAVTKDFAVAHDPRSCFVAAGALAPSGLV
jgi:hypothetical protein